MSHGLFFSVVTLTSPLFVLVIMTSPIAKVIIPDIRKPEIW